MLFLLPDLVLLRSKPSASLAAFSASLLAAFPIALYLHINVYYTTGGPTLAQFQNYFWTFPLFSAPLLFLWTMLFYLFSYRNNENQRKIDQIDSKFENIQILFKFPNKPTQLVEITRLDTENEDTFKILLSNSIGLSLQKIDDLLKLGYFKSDSSDEKLFLKDILKILESVSKHVYAFSFCFHSPLIGGMKSSKPNKISKTSETVPPTARETNRETTSSNDMSHMSSTHVSENSSSMNNMLQERKSKLTSVFSTPLIQNDSTFVSLINRLTENPDDMEAMSGLMELKNQQMTYTSTSTASHTPTLWKASNLKVNLPASPLKKAHKKKSSHQDEMDFHTEDTTSSSSEEEDSKSLKVDSTVKDKVGIFKPGMDMIRWKREFNLQVQLGNWKPKKTTVQFLDCMDNDIRSYLSRSIQSGRLNTDFDKLCEEVHTVFGSKKYEDPTSLLMIAINNTRMEKNETVRGFAGRLQDAFNLANIKDEMLLKMTFIKFVQPAQIQETLLFFKNSEPDSFDAFSLAEFFALAENKERSLRESRQLQFEKKVDSTKNPRYPHSEKKSQSESSSQSPTPKPTIKPIPPPKPTVLDIKDYPLHHQEELDYLMKCGMTPKPRTTKPTSPVLTQERYPQFMKPKTPNSKNQSSGEVKK